MFVVCENNLLDDGLAFVLLEPVGCETGEFTATVTGALVMDVEATLPLWPPWFNAKALAMVAKA